MVWKVTSGSEINSYLKIQHFH